ncbi:MAG: SDR family oxidoreductase [Rhodocyclaceae bacterium]|nr:3-phenylpropionate-dihydrodiol/cinnamic acid-dihydrodiol dehydrogenase [Rhodocyclaceae bacterium]MBZ0144098.1 SDR family oxidoreductase [Rhodocyclaceae bacterium]
MKAFITGASSGIGAALAAHYAARGAQLGLVARRREALADIARGLPGEPALYVADVADARAMRDAAQDFIARFGLPDIVIANAGISVGTLTEHAEDIEVLGRVLQTNVVGLAATFQPFVAPMCAARRGTLAGIASVAGMRGIPGAGAYSASKAAAITYLEALRIELKPCGVKVVTVCPGYVATPMTAVNKYRMPFILPADVAARRISRVIDAGRRYAVVPWQMALVARAMKLLPNAAYDRLFRRAGRKPRGLKL